MSLPASYYEAALSRPASVTPQDIQDIAGNVSERLMQVKVLYNFDDFSQTNCLARCPQPLSIQTAYIDATTQIGIIKLKSCIQAIVAASPELVTKLGQDYTVYAYDYSEYETPLVGQGLLSWVLASASSMPMAPAHQSNTMVTGRVCKNILGLFSNGVKETLEVKLKLVPVPTCLQTEYLDRMDKHRKMVRDGTDGLNADAWEALLNLGSTFDVMGDHSTTAAGAMGDGVGLPTFHQILSQNLGTEAVVCASQQEGFHASAQTSLGDYEQNETSRAVSAAPSNRSFDEPRSIPPAAPSRPSSRASATATKQVASQQRRRESTSSKPMVESHEFEDGPARKRARVEKTQWRGKQSFGVSADSLRVTASTAASIRGYRPIAPHPVSQAATSTEALPRPPTPRPLLALQGPRTTSQSFLPRQHSNLNLNSTGYTSPYSDGPWSVAGSDAPSVSPEKEQSCSASGTPDDIPSSPPVMRTISPAPSSPVLPTPPRDFDSGFMSGPPDETFEDVANDDMRPIDEEDRRTTARYKPRQSIITSDAWQEVVPGPPELLPRRILPRNTINSRKKADFVQPATSKEGSREVCVKTELISPSRLEAEKHGTACAPATYRPLQPRPVNPRLDEPSKSAPISCETRSMDKISEHVAAQPPAAISVVDNDGSAPLVGSHNAPLSGQPLQSTTPCESSAAGTTSSNALSMTVNGNAQMDPSRNSTAQAAQAETASGQSGNRGSSSSKPRIDGSVQRKKAIQARLAISVAEGMMPPYCHHCGAIETPTWRKSWTKIESGSPNPSQVAEEENVQAVEVMNRDERGLVTQYRVIRKTIGIEDQGWKELNLCNPCGIWLTKWQCMRPPEKWINPKKPSADKRRRPPRSKKASFLSDAPSECDRDDQHPQSEMCLDGSSEAKTTCTQGQNLEQDENVPTGQDRRGSLDGTEARRLEGKAEWFLQRAVQSSPPRLLGTKQTPIDLDLDLTPKPTKRLLFPSPRKEGEIKSLDYSSSSGHSPPQSRATAVTSHDAGINDKENLPPLSESNIGHEDEFAQLFEENLVPAAPARPTTPPTKSRSPTKANLLRTPGSRGIRKALTPKEFLSSAAKNLFLAAVTPTRSSSEKLLRSPSLQQMTPFTAQLNQLLSEANSSPLKTNSGDIDFSDLGLLTPRKTAAMFSFHDFGNDDFFSTDAVFPSSPPGMFQLYEDPQEVGLVLQREVAPQEEDSLNK